MLRRMLTYSPGSTSTYEEAHAVSRLSFSWTLIFPVAGAIAGFLLNGRTQCAVIGFLLGICLAFAVRAAFSCGELIRTADWEQLKTTPLRLIDYYLAKTSMVVRQGFKTSLLVLAAGSLLFFAFYGFAAIFWTILLAGLWLHLIFCVTGSVLAAGAFGVFNRSRVAALSISTLIVLLHAAVSVVSVMLAHWGMVLFAKLAGIEFGEWGYLGVIPFLPYFALIGPYAVSHIGPLCVIKADRNRRNSR